MTFERIGLEEKAIKYYENYLELAIKLSRENKQRSNFSGNPTTTTTTTENGNNATMSPDDVTRAYQHLVTAYKKMADHCDSISEYKEGVVYLERCLHKAISCGNIQAEGDVNHRLALAHKQLGNMPLVIQHLENYLQICRKIGDDVGEGVGKLG